MTNANDQSSQELAEMTQSPSKPMPNWLRNLLIVACGLLAIFAVGYLTGVSVAAIEDGGGFTARTLLLLALGTALAAGMVWAILKLLRKEPSEPVSARIRKNYRIYWISGGIGGVLGLVLSMGVVDVGSFDLFSNGPIAPTPAIFAMVVWLTAIPVLCWMWLRNIDEHEARANADGAVAAAYSYFMIAPVWWVGWRAGLFVEPQSMITFLVVLTIYCAVWMWRRYC